MSSLPMTRVTLRHFTLAAIAGLLAASLLVAFTATTDAQGGTCKCVKFKDWYWHGSCGDQPCSDFEKPEFYHWEERDCDTGFLCRYGGGFLGCEGFVSCGGITSDPDGEIPLGEPGQAALIACVLDAVPVTVDNTDDNAAVSADPALGSHSSG